MAAGMSVAPRRGGGPIKERGCTDVICCMLFSVFILANLLVGVWAILMGHPKRLIYPTDSYGNICGETEITRGKPYLFYFDMLQCAKISPEMISKISCPTPAVCVEKCPEVYWAWAAELTSSVVAEDNLRCKYHVNTKAVRGSDLLGLVLDEECAAYYIPSKSVAGRCVPTFLPDSSSGKGFNDTDLVDRHNNTVNETELQSGANKLLDFVFLQEEVTKVVNDFAQCWWIVLCFLGLSMLLSLLVIVTMRWIAGPIIWILSILFIAFFSFAIYYCFTEYMSLKDNPKTLGEDFHFSTSPDYYLGLYQTWLAFGIIASVVLGVMLLVLLFLRKRLLLAVALIEEASKAVAGMLSTLAWPLIPFVLQIIALAYWAGSTVCLSTVGAAEYSQLANGTNLYDPSGALDDARNVLTGALDQLSCDPNNSTAEEICNFVKYGDPKYTIYLQLFQLFVWFWVFNFITGLSQMTLAGAFASYYWAFSKPRDVPSFPLTGGLWRSVRYHMGSIAFGSLLVAIVQLIRVLLEFLDRRLRGAQNPVSQFILKCFKCFFWCLEKFLKFINRNAYILIAVSGKNFCTSAKNAFSLILRNVIRAAVLDSVTDFLIFACKLFIVGGVGVLSFFFFSGELANVSPDSSFSKALRDLTPQLHYYPVPVIVIVIATYIIASIFFSVYSMAVDTLFLCLLEDLEQNDGTAEKPYYMNKELMKIVGKKNKRSKTESKDDVQGSKV